MAHRKNRNYFPFAIISILKSEIRVRIFNLMVETLITGTDFQTIVNCHLVKILKN